jgi:hypothetical protein
VEAVCASGSGTATSGADGSYSITVTSGALPCVLRASSTGGAVLHSMAVGSSSAVVANITPATELMVGELAGADPATFYSGFNAAAAATVTNDAVKAAQADVVLFLKAAGIDLSGVGDLLAGSFAVGNAYDTKLDALTAAMTGSGTTLSTLTSWVVATSPISGSNAIDMAVLPASLLLQPAASNCAALRSGTYRIIMPNPNATLAGQSGLETINAGTLAVTRPDGSTGTLAANGACRFTDAATSADITVSPAGVLLGRYTTGSAVRNFIGFAEQAHTLADLAGNWNLAGMTPGSGSVDAAFNGLATLDVSGQWSAVQNCFNAATWDVSACAPVPASVTGLVGAWKVDSAGGFDVPDASTGAALSRVFAYQSGSGAVMLVNVSQVGFAIWSPVRAIPLPTVGTQTASWNFDLNPDLTSNSAVYETTNLIDSVDATAKSWTRTHGTVGSTVTRVETLAGDNPRIGYSFRAAAIVTGSDGSQQTVRELTQLRVVGMGLSAGVMPSLHVFELAANER